MTANYRVVVIFVSAAAAILCGVTLTFIITAITEYRAKDFFTASNAKDFSALGTCVEALTDKQLRREKYDDPNIYCGPDRESGNRLNVRNSLSVSLHGLYYTKFAQEAIPYEEATPATILASDVNAALNVALSAVITATVGGSDHEKKKVRDESGGQYHSGRFPGGVNFTQAYLALKYVSQQKVPTSCDEIYGLTSGTIKENLYGQIEFIKGIRDGKYTDSYDLGPKVPVKESWPLHDIAVDCDFDEAIFANSGERVAPAGNSGGSYALDINEKELTVEQIALLHAHCYAQYEYASVGTISGSGTWMIPLPGVPAGPNWLPYAPWTSLAETVGIDHIERARAFLGLRFGLSLFAYVPIFLVTCILLADAVVYFLSEITMPQVLYEMNFYYEDRLSQIRDSLVIAATSKTSRRHRLSLAILGLVACVVFYSVFIALPWGVFYRKLPRPICEGGEEDDGSLHFGFWLQTYGGWKSDWEATWYEFATFFALLFVTIIIPFSASQMVNDAEGTVDGESEPPGRLYAEQVKGDLELVHNRAEYRAMRNGTGIALVSATLVILASQIVPAMQFGASWLVSVVDMPLMDFINGTMQIEYKPRFDTVQLAEIIYDQTVATFAVTAMCGLVTGAMLQRYLFGGIGCMSTLTFFAWMALLVVFALPLLIYASIRSLFHETSAGYDCIDFADDGSTTATLGAEKVIGIMGKGWCTFRYWSFLGSGVLFLAAVGAITLKGSIVTVQKLITQPRVWSDVPYEGGGLAQAPKTKSRFFREGPANNVAAPLMQGIDNGQQVPLGGYRSSNAFFNFKTTRTDSDAFLYAPRMRTPSTR